MEFSPSLQDEAGARLSHQNREWKKIVNAFHRVFTSPDGRIVFEHLSHKFEKTGSSFMPPAHGTTMDPLLAAWRDGAKKPLLYVEWILQTQKPGSDDENAQNRANVL